MGCFMIPDYLLHEIESIIAHFWWGDGSANKIHWVNWYALCESKRDGGWALGTFVLLILQCWGNKFRELYIIRKPS